MGLVVKSNFVQIYHRSIQTVNEMTKFDDLFSIWHLTALFLFCSYLQSSLQYPSPSDRSPSILANVMAKSLLRMSPSRLSNVNQKRGSPITTFILLLAQPSATSTPHNSTNNNNHNCAVSNHSLGIHSDTLCIAMRVRVKIQTTFLLITETNVSCLL